MRRFLGIHHISDIRGFTIVELLVCMLILGIMAAIALPAWLDQRAKGQDAEAKLTLQTAAKALLTFESSERTFAATVAQLEEIEPALTEARNLRLTATVDTFELVEDSADGTEFRLERDAAGRYARDCSEYGYGLCRSDPDADGDHW